MFAFLYNSLEYLLLACGLGRYRKWFKWDSAFLNKFMGFFSNFFSKFYKCFGHGFWQFTMEATNSVDEVTLDNQC